MWLKRILRAESRHFLPFSTCVRVDVAPFFLVLLRPVRSVCEAKCSAAEPEPETAQKDSYSDRETGTGSVCITSHIEKDRTVIFCLLSSFLICVSAATNHQRRFTGNFINSPTVSTGHPTVPFVFLRWFVGLF